MQYFIDKIDKIFISIALAILLLITLLTTFDTACRYLLNSPIPGSYEMIEKWFMIFAVFLAMGSTYRAGSHIRLTIIEGLFSNKSKMKIVFNYIAQVVSVFFNVFLFIAMLKLAIGGVHEVWVATAFKIPMFPAYVVATVGLLFACLCIIIDLFRKNIGESSLFKDSESEKSEEITLV